MAVSNYASLKIRALSLSLSAQLLLSFPLVSLNPRPWSFHCPLLDSILFAADKYITFFVLSVSSWCTFALWALFRFSLAVGVSSSSKGMGFDENKRDGEEVKVVDPESEPETGGRISRNMSGSSLCTTEDEDDEGTEAKIRLGPQYTLKELSEKDKDDESLRKWKEQLLGSVDMDSVGETLDPEVKILDLAIKSPGRDGIVLPIPEDGSPNGPWFTLKEGSRYSLKFTFKVCNNIVSGLKYKNTVWKSGIRVDSTKEMIGTFSPQPEPYTHEMPEDTTPSGMFARGSYSARTQFLDDDNKCYLELKYTFDIKKDWLS